METEARQELEATLAARRELGAGHDDHLIEGFLQRMESEIDRRVDDRIATRGPASAPARPSTPAISPSASRSLRSRAGSDTCRG
jgi:hypothetical protein